MTSQWSSIGNWAYWCNTLVWPGKWGFGADDLATVTIEREIVDSQGNPSTETQDITVKAPGKSLWDGLNVLGVPLVLAILGAWFQKTQQEQAERTAREQREQDADEIREEVLQLYFDRISTLLIDKNLMAIASRGANASTENKELLESSLDVIRARTLSILRRFENDLDRKSSVIRFLAEAEIISRLRLNLKGADLQGIDLSGANLSKSNLIGVNLQGAQLYRTNFQEADLRGSNLSEANLSNANLQKAKISQANLKKVTLTQANLQEATLVQSNLEQSWLEQANFKAASLYGSRLQEIFCFGTNFEEANLSFANLEKANLHTANFQKTRLLKVKADDETSWPDLHELSQALHVPDDIKKDSESFSTANSTGT
ncbi:MAG: pentapeptide repeat-containing protein [Cyanobacteria bacterium P01_D01_bin.156]